MLFDGIMTDSPTLRRAILADALRADLPAGHTWDFGTYFETKPCGTVGCAIGVAHCLWPEAGLITRA